MKVSAFATLAPRGALLPYSYEAADLGPHDVEIEISHCGICHSDLHLIDDDWKISAYPLVPGHEIVGTVTGIGDSVDHLELEQRVGVGWQRSACLVCRPCLYGHENLCAHKQATCVGHRGGFASRIRVDSRFAFALPKGLDSARAAPLLCGGVTVYAPLRRHGVDATSAVGVIGIGGLGHMAILFLRAMGAEITAFSASADKREEALRMGAAHFVCSTDAREIRAHAGSLDLVLSTVPARLDWISYLQTLRPNGVLCLVASPPGIMQIPPDALLGQRSICFSEIGGRATIAEMLRCADQHGIAPQVETRPMAEVNAALSRLRQNQVRYRMVLENR